MGVTGLWKLIEPSGKVVPVETLENKVLAIDISIWLHQVVKGFHDNKGNALAHAHLLGLFNRLCKLMYYRIKPIFIFDGGAPQLKRETIAKRNQSRNKIINEADRLRDLILQSLAKEKIVQQALGANVAEKLLSPKKITKSSRKEEKEDMFKLPELPQISESPDDSRNSDSFTSDSSLDETNLRHSYNNQLQSIDVNSKYFLSLPADVRYEILADIKEARKQNSWGKLHELPAQLPDFSSFQMKRLLKRRQVQINMEEAEKEMEGKSLTLNELQGLLSDRGIVPAASTSAKDRIASDESTRFLLVRDLKKSIERAEKFEQQRKFEELRKKQERDEVKADIEKVREALGEDIDDLTLAIQMSLENDGIYKDEDYEQIKARLNRQQKVLLKDSATSSVARAFLIEYGGMDDDDVKELFEKTQNDLSLSFKFNDISDLSNPIIPDQQKESKENDVVPSITDGKEYSKANIIAIESDSEMESRINKQNTEVVNIQTEADSNIEILVNPSENTNDDLFADVFSQPITLSSETDPMESKSEIINHEAREQLKTDLSEIGIISDDSDSDLEITSNKDFEVNLIISEVELFKNKNIGGISNIANEKALKNTKEILKTNVEHKKQFIETALETNVEAKENNNFTMISSLLQSEKSNKIDTSTLANLEPKNPDEKSVYQLGEELIERKTKTNCSNVEVEDILSKLKEEAAGIKNLNFESIEIDTSILEISDSEDEKEKNMDPNENQVNEIIEILDDTTVSSLQKTPLKKIPEYFERKLLIKRTPEKSHIDTESIPKVKSPFFVNKTTPASTKKDTVGQTEEIRNSKVSKSLFGKNETNIESSTESLVNILRKNKSKQELENMATELANEKFDLELERNRKDRIGMTITEKMNRECMELLKLFGIPYICAPMEAEAQCGFLNAIELTDGTISDDSDIWLFGGQTVYKNFFNHQKQVLEFKMNRIEKDFNIDRYKLIQLAILVGSDYTTGINGVGAVTALEILAAFPRTPIKDGEVNEDMSILSSLRKFRDWYNNGSTVGPKNILRKKLKNIEISENFPNMSIINAYLQPIIDPNKESFEWGTPDIESIVEFAKMKFGWTRLKTEETLNPVMKRYNEKAVQTSIKNYFKIDNVVAKHDLKVSKRVHNAIKKMAKDYTSDDDVMAKPLVKKKRKTTPKVAEKGENLDNQDHTTCSIKNQRTSGRTRRQTKCSDDTASTSKYFGEPSKKIPKIPETKQIIPQREKDHQEMKKNKEIAAKLFKKSKK